MSVRLQLLFFTLAIILVGCRKEEPNPENLDKIYSDLVKIKGEKEGELAGEKKKLVGAFKALEEAVPQTLDLKNAKRDIEKTNRTIAKIEQDIKFLDIRIRRRLAEDRYNYHLAFVAGKEAEWPSQTEYAEYLTNSRLRNAPPMWGAHLPKLFDRKPAAKKKEEKKEEE